MNCSTRNNLIMAGIIYPICAEGSELVPFSKLKGLLAENKLVLGPDQSFEIFHDAESKEATLFATSGSPAPFDSEKLKEMEVGKFVVKLNTIVMRDDLATLVKSNIKSRSGDNTFGKVMPSFLPVLLLITLIFFLFRHQMKSAGKGRLRKQQWKPKELPSIRGSSLRDSKRLRANKTSRDFGSILHEGQIRAFSPHIYRKLFLH